MILDKGVIIHELGSIDYKECWDLQENIFSDMADSKISDRKNGTVTPKNNHLIICEHPHVFTLGKSGSENHLLISEEFLQQKNAKFYKINRGGDITYHGPGQIVVYPILDLEKFFTDIHKYLRYLEEAVIQTCAHYGIIAGRVNGLTGVWVDFENPLKARKICAMGVRCSRWVTMHGIALNVNTNLDYFNFIVPCGIQDKAVTSIQKELGKEINLEETKNVLMRNISHQFDMFILNP